MTFVMKGRLQTANAFRKSFDTNWLATLTGFEPVFDDLRRFVKLR